MRANLWTSLGTVGPGLAVRSLICLVLATGCTDPPLTGPVDPGQPPATPNQQPRPQGSIPPQELQEGADITLNVGSYFSDPDGDQLTYTATSQPADVVAVTTSGSGTVTIFGLDVGTGTVTVTARDPGRLNATQSFNVTVTERPVGVCDRTAQVRDAILALVGVTECASVTLSQLAGIKSLVVSDSGLSGLQEGDFELLPGLTVLHLGSNQLSQLPQAVFSDLDGLQSLNLSNNSLQGLPAGVFSGLSSLIDLEMHGNHLSRLPDGAFSGLSRLRVLGLDANRLSQLSQDIFSGLSNLESLDLWQNSLQELPVGVFAGLASLRELDLHANQLSELPRTVFSNLSNLESLNLSTIRLRELPAGVFAGLSSLKALRLDANQLQSLPQGVFVGLSELRDLALDGNPGSPFGLMLRFERTDATLPTAPGPTATVRVVLAEGAPLPITVPLSVRGGSFSPASISLPRGDTVSGSFTVRQTSVGNPARVTATRVPEVPDAITGVELVAPDELVLFGGGTANSCAQADATDLAYGDSIRGSITPAGDTDCFRVTSPGGWLTAYTEGATDTRGSLSDRSYNGLESDDNDGPQDNFLIRRDLSSGTYYLQVAGQQANTTGAYLLKVDDHGDSRQTATPLAVGDSVAGNIVTPGNVDFFRIEVREAGQLTVLTTGETDTQGYLYDGSGGLLAENDDGVIDLNFRIARQVGAGTYYVEVRGYDNTSTGSYVLNASSGTGGQATTILRDDFNNSSSLARWLVNGEPAVSGGMLRLTNSDYWAAAVALLNSDVSSWEIRARMGRSVADSMFTSLVFAPSDPGVDDIEYVRLDVGHRIIEFSSGTADTVNYALWRLATLDGRTGWWSNSAHRGVSRAVNDAAGALTEITMGVQDGVFRVLAGTETLFTFPVSQYGPSLSAIATVEFWSHDNAYANPGLLDWIEVTGVPSGSSANADRDSRPRLAQPDFLRDLQAVQEVPRAVCQTRKCP